MHSKLRVSQSQSPHPCPSPPHPHTRTHTRTSSTSNRARWSNNGGRTSPSPSSSSVAAILRRDSTYTGTSCVPDTARSRSKTDAAFAARDGTPSDWASSAASSDAMTHLCSMTASSGSDLSVVRLARRPPVKSSAAARKPAAMSLELKDCCSRAQPATCEETAAVVPATRTNALDG